MAYYHNDPHDPDYWRPNPWWWTTLRGVIIAALAVITGLAIRKIEALEERTQPSNCECTCWNKD
jgi:hypothetical protein